MISPDQHLYQSSVSDKKKRRSLLTALSINFVFGVVETFIAFYTGSLAVISDALGAFGDFLATSLAYVSQRFLLKPPTEKRTFGNLRITILVAFFNAIALYAVTFFIFSRAIDRLFHPQAVSGLPILLTGLIGFLLNGLATRQLFSQRKEIDIKSVFFHSLGDSLGSLGVMIVGAVAMFANLPLIDPIVSIAIGMVVLYGAFRASSDAISIFLEGTPKGMDVNKIKNDLMEKFQEVDAMHDIHVWVLGPGKYALSAHLAVEDMTVSDSRLLLNRVKNFMRNNFNVWHTAFELECPSCLTPWDIPEEQK